MEVAPPPEAVAARPRKRCPHDYCDKWRCPLCNPCPGGHGKRKSACGICNGSVAERDAVSLEEEQQRIEDEDFASMMQKWREPHLHRPVPAASGQKCGHTYLGLDSKLHAYTNKRSCPTCNNCGHNTTKSNCYICNDCGHGKLKRNCKVCDPCPHGYSKNNCRFHATLPIILGN